MERYSFAFRIKEGKVGEFLGAFGKCWGDIRNSIRENGASNFSLWNCDTFFFGYYEKENMAEKEIRNDTLKDSDNECDIYTKSILSPVLSIIDELSVWKSDFNANMDLMYEDFGIVRKDKSMIRHRVFMTHLLNGDTREYKRRHDELAGARIDVTKGPDSNFSIWNSGDYIFGYDEIDTSMEHEMTEVERESTINWEKHMLDIMEWITDDVDWITGMHHSHVKRIAHER